MFSFLRSNSFLHQASFWSYLTSTHYKTAFDLNEDLAKVEETPLPQVGGEEMVVNGRKIADWIAIAQRVTVAAQRAELNQTERTETALLEQQLIALKMRVATVTAPVAKEEAERFRAIILKYCHERKIHPRAKNDQPSEQIKRQWEQRITHTLQSQPLFVQAVVDRHARSSEIECRDEWTSNYVKWSLRSGASDDVFVKMPNECALIRAAHLDKRSGAVSGDKGFIIKDGVLCMRIDAEDVPIQGRANKEREITFSYWNKHEWVKQDKGQDAYTIKVKEIFAQFKKKTAGYEELEWIEGRGAVLWNTIHLGSYRPSTKTHLCCNSLDELPVFKKTTAEELSYRYGRPITLAQGQWAVGFCVTRLTPDDNISDCHSYLEIVRPLRADPTQFEIIPIGHQPFNFPQNLYQKLTSLGDTLPSGMHIFDESYYLTHRQRTAEWFVYDEGALQIQYLKTAINQSIAQGKGGALVFQPTGNNCSHWVQAIYRQVILHDFSERLKAVATRLLPPNGKERTERIFSELTDNTLNSYADQLIAQADKQDLQELYTILCDYISLLNRQPIQQSTLQFINNYAKTEFKRHLATALRLAIRSQKLFKQDPFEAKYSNFLRSFANFGRWFSSIYLRNKIASLFLFIFVGSWRGVNVHDVAEDGTVLTTTHRMSRFAKPDHFLYLPAALFKWQAAKENRIRELGRLLRLVKTAARFPESAKNRKSWLEVLSEDIDNVGEYAERIVINLTS
jgi:hypothetical protein